MHFAVTFGLTAGRSALHAGVRSALADITLLPFVCLRRSGQLPTLAGGGCARIFEQSNSNVT